MTWHEWEAEQWEQFREAAAIRAADVPTGEMLSSQAIATPRDSYGWRSLPGPRHVTIRQKPTP